jgi:tetratricopeptide (TPR) repeat protein
VTLGATLVGRDRELGELRHGLERALAGHGGLYMVAGDPGVGKTALADAAGAEAVAAGALVLWGRAWDGGGAPAYWPWMRILRRLAAERDVTRAAAGLGPEAAARLARLVPDLVWDPADAGAADAPAEADPGDSDAARFQLFDAVTSLLRAAAAEGPLVIIVDDLHGVDHPSQLLLGFLAMQLRDAPILVIGTYREAEARLDPQLAATLSDIIRHGQRLPLRGLRERDVAAIVERVAGTRPADRVVRAIHDATEGNPFFIDEVVRLLSAEGRLDDAAKVVSVRIPDGVRETIRHRLAPLPDNTRILLLTAAVIGRNFRLDTLQRVCDLEPAELDAALSEAVSTGVVVERMGALGGYSFSHGLIRETLYDDLGPQRRGQLHRNVGLALEDVYVADTEPHVAELAHHFFVAATAGELAKAIDYSVRAGERAVELVAYEEATEHFERALQAYGLQERADVPRRCDLLLSLGAAQSRTGDTRSARETFIRAAGLARKLRSPERLARAALGFGAGMGGFEFGRVDETLVALLQEARDALGEGSPSGPQDSPLLARVLGRLATELYFSDRTAERIELSEQAIAMARRTGDRAALGATLSARFLTLWGPENTMERLQIAGDVVALGEEARDRELVLRGHVWRIVTLMEIGDWVGADIEFSVHARLADELRDPLHLWYVPLFRSTRALLEGRLADAERFSGEAFAIGRETQAQNAAQLYAVQLFALRTEQGRLGEIQQSLEEFGRRYPAAPVWRAAAAYALASLGRRDDARRAFEALAAGGLAEVPRDGEWLTTVSLLVGAGAQLGDTRRVGELGDLLTPYVDQAVIAGRGAICLGPVARFAGMAAAAMGRDEEAIGHLDHALTVARRWGAEPIVAAVRLELAEVLARSPDLNAAERSSTLRREGLAAAERLGLGGLLERWSPGEPEPLPAPDPIELGFAVEPLTWDFYRRGDIWTVGPRGRQVQLRHAKGLSHVARLLAAPRVEFHALDLVAGPQGRGGSPAVALADGMAVRARGEGDAGPVLDSEAKAAYRARVNELQEEIDEAESFNDPERAARARDEMSFVARELAGAVGLGGRDRKASSDAERARVNVTRAIRTALRRIGDHDPALGRRLGQSIRTGTFCVYDPPAGDEPAWDLTGPA